ncbi:MAG TPA: DUF222 domain-containing protein, partial [Streptosporangiaceae bacterium]|nr:DUF222 domain-containing protein [Streptosporangiaceae bacterium]
VIHGDLTPQCASLAGTVLDALGGLTGTGDGRSREQRYHDALQEAMRRLVAAGLLPERAGQPVKALVHISLAGLVHLNGAAALTEERTGGIRARRAARRAAACETGSDGGAWLDGKAAEAAACDASLTPIVTGDLDVGVLDDLVRLGARLDRLRRHGTGPGRPGSRPAPRTPRTPGTSWSRRSPARPPPCSPAPAAWRASCAAASPAPGWPAAACPRDVGVSSGIPAAIRPAVIERDQHCVFPSGCDQPAAGCEVHHLTHNPDGSVTAWNKDRTKILHSHSPPARPG